MRPHGLPAFRQLPLTGITEVHFRDDMHDTERRRLRQCCTVLGWYFLKTHVVGVATPHLRWHLSTRERPSLNRGAGRWFSRRFTTSKPSDPPPFLNDRDVLSVVSFLSHVGGCVVSI